MSLCRAEGLAGMDTPASTGCTQATAGSSSCSAAAARLDCVGSSPEKFSCGSSEVLPMSSCCDASECNAQRPPDRHSQPH